MEITVRFPNLGFLFEYEDRIFSVLGFDITIYGILMAVSLLIGLGMILLCARWQKLNLNLCLGASISALVGGVIGGRLYYIAFSWSQFSGKSWKILCDIRSGGISIYGAILGGVLVAALFCRLSRTSFWKMADIVCMGLLSGQIIGVWGNFFNREAFGEYTDSLFAMGLPMDSVQKSAVTKLMKQHLVTFRDMDYIQVHPLFFYESIWCLLLLLILLLSLLPRVAYAEETADAICIEGETEGLDTDAVDAATEEMDAGVSFSDLLAEILSGEFDFTFANIKEKALELTFGELRMQGRLLAQLVLIVILSAILKQCSDSFQGKNVGEMGFYVCYMVLIVAILTSFYSISQSVVERMRGLCGVFGAMVPIFLVLSASSGNLTQGALMGPTLMGGATALSVGISYVLIPAIQLSIALEMTDHISEKPILGKFAELLRQCISWGMKGAAMLFMLLLSLQKIGGGTVWRRKQRKSQSGRCRWSGV